jgi:hypothetical protein
MCAALPEMSRLKGVASECAAPIEERRLENWVGCWDSAYGETRSDGRTCLVSLAFGPKYL